MSTDTLFRSIPTRTLSDVKTNDTATVEPTPTTTTTPPNTTTLVSTPSVLTPNVELSNTALFPNTNLQPKRDISSIPPIFFVGPQTTEDAVMFEPQFNTDSGSVVSYGDRRLSGVATETNDKQEEEKKETSTVPVKRVALGVADNNRGIFGNKHLKVQASDQAQTETPQTTPVSILKPSRSIRVFGYPPSLVHNVIQHFMTYGKIENYQISAGNWITITFENSSMALAALKSNGVVISKSYLIGVSLEEEETTPAVAKNIIPMDVSNGVYKQLNNVDNGLGSGKVGVSAEGKYSAATGGVIAKLKDVFFGW